MSKLLVTATCLTLMLPGFSQSDDYFPKAQWRTADPQSQGLDPALVTALIADLQSGELVRPVSSFSIVRNGYLVVNEYFGGYRGTSAHTMQSVTKSITATLVAVAVQNGFIDDLDQPILSFFPEYDDFKHWTADKKVMNLRHALTMQTGQHWTGESHLGALNRYRGDKMKYVLDYAMEGPPGRKWYYNSGIAILLGGLIQNATGMNTKKFAEEHLFTPIGISDARWSWGHQGIPHTGGGLYLTPDAMARIGYLYLKNGRWQDQQILPGWWIKESLDLRVPFAEKLANKVNASYGYMWWLLPLDAKDRSGSADIYMAYGHWGQFIFVIPQYEMVVTWTNNNSASYAEELKPIRLLYDRILPLVMDQ